MTSKKILRDFVTWQTLVWRGLHASQLGAEGPKFLEEGCTIGGTTRVPKNSFVVKTTKRS